MKTIHALSLATVAALSLGACTPSETTVNNSTVTELSVNEGDLSAESNFSAVDGLANAPAADTAILANDSLGNAGSLGNEAGGNTL